MDIHLTRLAKRIGVSNYILSTWFKGSSNMESEELERTIKELEKDSSDLSRFLERAKLELALERNKKAVI